MDRYGVVIVGGGQAGLATGYYLSRQKLRFVILDAHDRVGDAWRLRWDSLRLFTPARLDALPGLRFPADPDALVTKDAMADYLEGYATRFALPVYAGTRVESVELVRGRFQITTGSRILEADQVVVATGGHPVAQRPAFAAELDAGILQLHSSEYRRPSQLRAGEVLVVGAGNSGAEIALETAASHRTWLAGRDTGTFNPRLYARLPWWLLKQITDSRTPFGRRLAGSLRGKGTPPVRVRAGDLARAGIRRVSRVAGVRSGLPVLDDGTVLEVQNVVWCTGYGHDFSWIHLPDGVGSVPGLHFIGLPFQSNLASALVDGVGRDAQRLAEVIGGIA